MRVFILIACLFTFAAGSFADLAHAVTPDTMCSHHEAEVSDVDQDCADEQTQSQEQFGECQDCCCIHAHILAGLLPDTSVTNFSKERMALPPHSSLRSNDHSPLYRPPIA